MKEKIVYCELAQPTELDLFKDLDLCHEVAEIPDIHLIELGRSSSDFKLGTPSLGT